MHRPPGLPTGRITPVAWFSAAVIAVDQVTKAAASMAGPGSVDFIHPVRNNALSLQVADASRGVEVLLMTLGVIAATLLARHWVRARQTPAWAAALVIGGAASNLADRAIIGAVRDFLAVGPVVLNLADLAVLAGLVVALHHRRSTRARFPGREVYSA